MIWKDDRTLTFDEDGPSVLHVHTLAIALRDAVGDKPSTRFLDGALLALNFHVDLDAVAKSTVEAVVAAHDGTAALATDVAAAEQRRTNEETKRDDLDMLRQKRRDGQKLTPAEQERAFDIWLGV